MDLDVNGVRHAVDAAPAASLLETLRETLDLRGTRVGCGGGECGACHVLVDGRSTASCITPLSAVAGAQVVTAEGLGAEPCGRRLRAAFIEEQAAQCGYCTSGMLVGAAALLRRQPRPSEVEVRAALDPHLCRCGAHPRIVRAVLRAATGEAAASPRAHAAPAPAEAAETPLPPHLQRHPRPSQWLRFLGNGTVRVTSGKVEIGQGIHAALAQIVADALGLDLEQVHLQHASTAVAPDEGVTSGSLSVQDSGSALRAVCAIVHVRCTRAAADRLREAAATLRFGGGRWSGADGRSLAYADLADAAVMERPVAADEWPAAALPRRWVGRAEPRAEVAALVRGSARFIQDLVLPGLLHGRVLHPQRPGDRLRSVDDARARSVPGVRSIHRDGQLLGVLAATPAAAEAALEALRAGARYEGEPPAALEPMAPALVGESGTPAVRSPQATLKAAYTKPALAHASIGPSCALARAGEGGSLEVWSHSQGIHNLGRDLALAFGIDAGGIVVHHHPGAGCYGHNAADDVAFDAAWLACRCPGEPVRVLWSRADELSRAPFGPAMRLELEADLDAEGRVLAWRHDLWSPGHSSRPGRAATPALLGCWQTASPVARSTAIDVPAASGGGAERNAVPGYALPAWRVRRHRVGEGTLRASALRSLGAYANVFAIESFVDELALRAGSDPLAWRLAHLPHDPRAAAVLRLAAERGGWSRRGRERDTGFGLGVARYKGQGAWCAVLAEVDVSAELVVRRLCIAGDVGLAINPDGVAQQFEGGAIQATSWALKEAVQTDGEGRVVSDSWGGYPILRFSEVPAIEVHLVASEAPSLGAGEASLGPTAAAIANALADGLGLRVRDLPLTRERLHAAAAAAA